MITRKQLKDICERYFTGIINQEGYYGKLKYQGWVTICFPLPYVGFVDYATPVTPTIPISYNKSMLEITTSYNKAPMVYRFKFNLQGEKSFVCEFGMPAEVFSFKALTHMYVEVQRLFEEAGVIKLTPQEEYAEEKKKLFAELYGAGNKSVAELKVEIEQLKHKKTQQWVIQGPDGNMHVASPDESQKIMHQVMHTAQMAMEAATSEPIFNSLKAMAEQYYKDFGTYPDLETFGGMKKAFEDLEKEVYSEYETDPYMGQHIYQGGHKQGKTVQIGIQGGSFKSPQSYDNAGNELAKIIPALTYTGAMCPTASKQTETSNSRCHMQGQTLSELIIHLNDHHKWPRSGTDPNPHNLPNIADWIDEVCLTHGLDQSFHPKEEKKPSVRDWSKIKEEKEKKGLPYPKKDNPIWKGMFDGA